MIIIDIRDKEKFNCSNIKNSINIELLKINSNPSKFLNKEDTYYIYCQHGKQSVKTCLLLSKLGYNVVNIIGGYEQYLLNKK